MAVGQGFSKVVTSGSVFHYDTGDVINSFKGKPTTNLLLDIGYTYGTQNQPYFKSSYGTEYDIIPGLGGPVLVNYCNFFNDYPGGSGNCCPSVFYFGNFSVSPSTIYTYQLIYKTPDGYANANYMYHYEYGPGGYVTEYGLWSDTRTQDLGNGWVHAWGTFTSNAATNYFQTYLFHYQYTQTKIQIAGVMLTQGDVIIPPRQFISVNTTRSNTQGLLDLAGSNTIDLINVTFNTNGNMTFDGTNDYISLPTNVIPTNQITIEFVCTNTNLGANNSIIAGGADQTQDLSIHLPWGDGNVYWDCGRPFNRIAKTTTLAERSGVHHWVFTKNPSTGVMNIYLDGNLWHTGNGFTSTMPSLSSVSLGRYDNGGFTGYYFPGTIPITKIYNKELTPGEVTQNYNHYKTRFNLP